MKAFSSTLVVAVLFVLLATSNASAAFSEFKMVGSSGSTVEQTVFGWDETPYLYVKLPRVGVYADIETDWFSPEASSYEADKAVVLPGILGSKSQWISLSNWNDVKQVGTWNVSGAYEYLLPCSTGEGVASFVVTPEPVSLLLYGLGGLPLAAHLTRRKKTV